MSAPQVPQRKKNTSSYAQEGHLFVQYTWLIKQINSSVWISDQMSSGSKKQILTKMLYIPKIKYDIYLVKCGKMAIMSGDM